jgi:hypothetical protein
LIDALLLPDGHLIEPSVFTELSTERCSIGAISPLAKGVPLLVHLVGFIAPDPLLIPLE